MEKGLRDWRKARLRKHKITNFWYLTRIENLKSILSLGILPKNDVDRFAFIHKSFAEETVQERRHSRIIELSDYSEKHIHDLVPVYLCTKTPTQYARKDIQDELVLIRIHSDVLLDDMVEFAFSDGNAASAKTSFYRNLNDLGKLSWDILRDAYWTNYDDGKRKKCSEFLIHPKVRTTHFLEIGVSSLAAQGRASRIISKDRMDFPINVKENWFF